MTTLEALVAVWIAERVRVSLQDVAELSGLSDEKVLSDIEWALDQEFITTRDDSNGNAKWRPTSRGIAEALYS